MKTGLETKALLSAACVVSSLALIGCGDGQWDDAETELTYECGSTLEGGDLEIVLDSLEDRDRTAIDAVNSGWCEFNKELKLVWLVLESDSTPPYAETFWVKPSSEIIYLPIPEEYDSEIKGERLPSGEYSRRMVAVAADGSETEIMVGPTNLITLGRGVSESDLPIIFPQHREERSSYAMSTTEYIEGFLQLDARCMHIRNSVLIWPPDFNISEADGSVTITDEDGKIVARDGEYAKFKGRRISDYDNPGRRIRWTLPYRCPVDRLWIVGE